jgi:hypothetical protein
MGPTALLPLLRKACWGILFRPKIPDGFSRGLNTRTWLAKARMLTTRPLKTLSVKISARRVLRKDVGLCSRCISKTPICNRQYTVHTNHVITTPACLSAGLLWYSWPETLQNAVFFVTVGSLLSSTTFIITVSLMTTESHELRNNVKQKRRGGGRVLGWGERQVNYEGDEFDVGRNHSFILIKVYLIRLPGCRQIVSYLWDDELSSGYFPGVWVLEADVSEHCVGSIFTTCWRWNRHSVPKRRILILRRRRNTV